MSRGKRKGNERKEKNSGKKELLFSAFSSGSPLLCFLPQAGTVRDAEHPRLPRLDGPPHRRRDEPPRDVGAARQSRRRPAHRRCGEDSRKTSTFCCLFMGVLLVLFCFFFQCFGVFCLFVLFLFVVPFFRSFCGYLFICLFVRFVCLCMYCRVIIAFFVFRLFAFIAIQSDLFSRLRRFRRREKTFSTSLWRNAPKRL